MNWTEYFYGIAEAVSEKSKDRHTKVGAVIVGPDKEIRSTGFNGIPRGVTDVYERYDKPDKYVWIEHAERNAIFQAARSGASLDGCTLYVYGGAPVCHECARAIIQSGIKKVVSQKVEHERLRDSHAITTTMFKEADIDYVFSTGVQVDLPLKGY